jgi:hypothetical protein
MLVRPSSFVLSFGIFLIPSFAIADDKADMCASLSDMARSIMGARQNGAAMSEMIKIAQNTDPKLVDLVSSIVVAAYDEPRFSSPEYQREAVDDFGNAVYLTCFKSR